MTTETTEKRRALGRGLESLLPSRPGPAAAALSAKREDGEAIHQIAVEHIEANPYQTRRRAREDGLKELADSIRAAGVVQPVVVRYIDGHRYQLIAGERRWQASKLAGKATVPAIVRRVTNEQAMEMTIIENLQREDLNAMEQARAYERLGQEFGLTQEQMAQRTGKDRASVANFLRLLKLPTEVQGYVETNAISFGHAKVLMMLSQLPEQILPAARKVVKDSLSVRQTEELVYRILNPDDAVKPAAKARPAADPNVRAAEEELRRALGVKVTIKDRRGKGKIILEYGSLEDFDRVLEVLGK